MDRDLEKIILDLIVGIIIIGLLSILFKVIEFVLKRLFTLFRF